MRSDMSKVIVERPRSYRGRLARKSPGYPRARMRRLGGRSLSEQPTREGMSRGARYGEKRLNENLAPLARFLRAQVGRPWDKVHSEISEHLRLTSAVQRHVLEHLSDIVEVHVVERDGRLYAHAWSGLQLLGLRRRRYGWLYVCPRTGLLRELRRAQTLGDEHTRRLSETRWLVRVRGVWNDVRLARLPDSPASRRCFDALVRAFVGSRAYYAAELWARPPWGTGWYAITARALTARERRALLAG
jgi:hypothetical protein